MNRRRLGIVAGALALIAMTGCAPGSDSGGSHISAADATSAADALTRARSEGVATPDQIAVLEDAEADGRAVTESEYRAAVDAAAACIEDEGLTVRSINEDYILRVLYLSMTVDGGDGPAVFDTINSCTAANSAYIERAYTVAPESVASVQEVTDHYLPAMRECVRAAGGSVGDDASYDEVLAADKEITGSAAPETSCYVQTNLVNALD